MRPPPPFDLERWALRFPDAAAALFDAAAGHAFVVPRAWSRECMGDRLADARARAGFTQAAFAETVGMPLERLRLCEHGFCPFDPGLLGKAAEVGVDVRYVLMGTRQHIERL